MSETQSVCKHCGKEITPCMSPNRTSVNPCKGWIHARDGWHTCAGKYAEPVAEPASTLKGLDPELYEQAANRVVELHEPASTGEPPKCSCPCHKGESVICNCGGGFECEYINSIPAARPSEPSAPQPQAEAQHRSGLAAYGTTLRDAQKIEEVARKLHLYHCQERRSGSICPCHAVADGMTEGCHCKEETADIAAILRPYLLNASQTHELPSVEEIIKLLGYGWRGFKLDEDSDLVFFVDKIRLAIMKCTATPASTARTDNQFTVLDDGHDYLLRSLDGSAPIRLTFVKRCSPPEKFPGNYNAYPGTTSQEVRRALINRAQYVNGQIVHPANNNSIQRDRQSIYELEQRAAERHGRTLALTVEEIERIETFDTCGKCGHILPEKHSECAAPGSVPQAHTNVEETMICGNLASAMENATYGNGAAGETFFCEGCKQDRQIEEEYTRCEDSHVCNKCADSQIYSADQAGVEPPHVHNRNCYIVRSGFKLGLSCGFPDGVPQAEPPK